LQANLSFPYESSSLQIRDPFHIQTLVEISQNVITPFTTTCDL
jgi:hypothetical protein